MTTKKKRKWPTTLAGIGCFFVVSMWINGVHSLPERIAMGMGVLLIWVPYTIEFFLWLSERKK